MKLYYVYKIEINSVVRYIGITDNPKRREKEHNYLLSKDKKKELYNGVKLAGLSSLELKIIAKYPTKLEAQRYEAHLILIDYFTNKQLWQAPPHLFRYF